MIGDDFLPEVSDDITLFLHDTPRIDKDYKLGLDKALLFFENLESILSVKLKLSQ